MPPPARRPSRDELRAAAGRTLPDLIGPDLRLLFCGINPGLYSAFTGHHFARPGNRFWPALHAAGLTPRRLQPWERHELLAMGYGLTNLVARATASADELAPDELIAGAAGLAEKVAAFRPRTVALLGVSAYRTAFRRPRATIGRQPEQLHGAALWVLPSPSGLNAHYTPAALARSFAELRAALESEEA
jgi:TDG/mug DNA glycosylase family protein